jgi:hypothetical protein
LQKNLKCKARIIEIKLSCSATGRKKRQSESNKREFNNDSKPLPDALLDYLNSIEILNRQSLPLRSNYNRKVQEYFNKKMINFNYENEFNLENEDAIASWLSSILSEGKKEGEINYIDDEYLHKINLEYLNIDDLTDIISFDNVRKRNSW